MAKQEIRYVCEVCGAKFLKKEIATECEKKHYKPVEIAYTHYDLNDNKNEYPSTMEVKLKRSDGMVKTITYYRHE